MYATCALEADQNEGVVEQFERASGGEGFVPWALPVGAAGRCKTRPHLRTLWPHLHGTDGFFVARWVRGLG